MRHLFDLVVEDEGWYNEALETLVSIGVTRTLQINAELCPVEIIRRLCSEALHQLGAETKPVQLPLFKE